LAFIRPPPGQKSIELFDTPQYVYLNVIIVCLVIYTLPLDLNPGLAVSHWTAYVIRISANEKRALLLTFSVGATPVFSADNLAPPAQDGDQVSIINTSAADVQATQRVWTPDAFAAAKPIQRQS
jgi:hypothetical protein